MIESLGRCGVASELGLVSLEYWFYEYCGVSHPIVKEDVKFTAYPRLRAWERGNRRKENDQATNLIIQGKFYIDHRIVDTITQEPWLESTASEIDDVLTVKLLSREERETYASYWAEQTSEVGHMSIDSQRMGNIDLFGLTALRAGTVPMVVMSASAHSFSFSQDFSLPGETEGLDLGLHMEWTGRREMLPITRMRDPLPMYSSYDTEKLRYLTPGIRKIDSIDHQLFAPDLQLRRGRDVRMVQLPPRDGARTRQCGSDPKSIRIDFALRCLIRIDLGSIRIDFTLKYFNLLDIRDLAVKRTSCVLPRGVLFTAKSLISKPTSSSPFAFPHFILLSSIENLFTIWYYTLLSTPQPQMSSSSPDSSIPDPPGLSSSSSSEDLIFDCAVAICILYQATMNIVVKDATSSYGESVTGRKDKIKKRDYQLGHYNII
ncbi:hypothetical protein GIB67_028303 [Kingdonia uniflora]|uniref:Uncharacterized protein n=1 Tax=Kingdonia uniflora TaxID=39325 RepID=A0A7J7MHT5_9MAGN|nr:hypothetical protein GIB67_028303 [Kingdonia uniflora]